MGCRNHQSLFTSEGVFNLDAARDATLPCFVSVDTGEGDRSDSGRTPEIDVAKNADVFFYLEAYAGSERLAQRVREIDPAHPGICATHHCTISMAR